MTKTPNPRQIANRAILARLSAAVELYPDSRFGQLLVNLDTVILNPKQSPDDRMTAQDPFYEESRTTLSRMEQRGPNPQMLTLEKVYDQLDRQDQRVIHAALWAAMDAHSAVDSLDGVQWNLLEHLANFTNEERSNG